LGCYSYEVHLNQSLALHFDSRVRKLVEPLAEALENRQETNPQRLRVLGHALTVVAMHTDPSNAVPVAERLAKAIQNPQEKNPERLARLAYVLAALANRLSPSNAVLVTTRAASVLAQAMESPII